MTNYERPKIFFGASGKLGKVFTSENLQFLTPTSKDVPIENAKLVNEYLRDINPSLIIHAAAVVGLRESEADPDKTYMVNVEGTSNIAKGAMQVGARLAYVSSVSVFDGRKGQYTETDIPCPAYYYGWTKLLGEQAVTMLKNHVIVRTDFFDPNNFKYKQAMSDHYCSKIPVRNLAEALKKIAESEYVGIINVGRKRESLLEILREYIPEIQGIKIEDSAMLFFPRDLSMDVNRYLQLFS